MDGDAVRETASDPELEVKVSDGEVKDDDDEVKDTVKVSVVGDSGVGKTCMLMTFVNKKYPDEEERLNRHSLFENTSGTVHGNTARTTTSVSFLYCIATH